MDNAGPFDYVEQLRQQALDKRLAEAAAAHPAERVILFVDRRAASPIGVILAIVTAASPWFDLLPPAQIAEIRERGSNI